MEYGCLANCIRSDAAEIWGFKYGLTLIIGTLQIMARTGVFVKSSVYSPHSKEPNPQQAEQGHAQMQQCL
jgi:hypothetical protein